MYPYDIKFASFPHLFASFYALFANNPFFAI